MSETPAGDDTDVNANAFATLRDKIYIHELPSYGNKIFFSLGFMALTSLVLLVLAGITMAFMGQAWWLGSPWGIYVRSVHLWAVQAFIAILVLHILVGFITSGFRKPRRMVWVFGAAIFCLALITTEFGYGLRGDFDSQYRAVSGADFWNGSYLGHWLNPLNYMQVFSLHVIIIPLSIFLLFLGHYLLERTYGISKPYRADIKYKMVAADHKVLFIRGGALAALILVFAFFFHSPYVAPITIASVAAQDPSLVSATLQQEFDRTSDTATYLDSIDPYTFDTRQVYVVVPYEQYVASTDSLAFSNTAGSTGSPQADPAAMIATLMPLAKSGLYESLVSRENPSSNDTYTLRFLNDMGVLDAKASSLNMDTAQWGMVKDDAGSTFLLPPGSWWFAPLAIVNSIFNLPNNPNGDRIAAEILGFIMLMFILFPYIPYLNRLPELLHLAPFIWK
jgi:hypothetical protein